MQQGGSYIGALSEAEAAEITAQMYMLARPERIHDDQFEEGLFMEFQDGAVVCVIGYSPAGFVSVSTDWPAGTFGARWVAPQRVIPFVSLN